MTRTALDPSRGTITVVRQHPCVEVPASPKFGQRARLRLHVAARLLRMTPSIAETEDDFLVRLLNAIRGRSPARQAELRALVDWVEDYDNALRSADGGARRSSVNLQRAEGLVVG